MSDTGPPSPGAGSTGTVGSVPETEADEDNDRGNKPRITWRRSFDFTLTVVGYTVGIHDFWRFPYLCYIYGGVFYIPFIFFIIVFYFPTVFLDFTIGQYHGVGSTEAFGEMAPILTGVSFVLAWNSLSSCWLYAMMISWSRLYSDDATSCTQGWLACDQNNYYITERCFTGLLDQECQNKSKLRKETNVSEARGIYYNYDCVSLNTFCSQFDATFAGNRTCRDKKSNATFSIYTRRTHASGEYFYGGLCGLHRVKSTNERGHKYVTDPLSASEGELFVFSFTTFIIIGFFLHEGLLAVSFITYLLNAGPFLALGYFTYLALNLEHAYEGVKELASINATLLMEPRIWVDAVLQVICCTGIGNGVLINLSTFNKFDHNYLYETSIAGLMNLICSTCATLICFSAIGHARVSYRMDVAFRDFIKPESKYSSLEFGYIIYTQFLSLIVDQYITVLIFFFMITSFSMDSALRLVQNSLDAVTFIFPRLRRHRLASLIGICLFGFAAVLPMTRNGGVFLFWEYEYFIVRFVWPLIAFIQIVGVTWIYKTSRALDNAEQIGVINARCFRWYITGCMQYFIPPVLLFTLGYNGWRHGELNLKFINADSRELWNEVFGWALTATPILIFILAVTDQLLLTDRARWVTLLSPATGRSVQRSIRRRTGLSVTNYGAMSLHGGGGKTEGGKPANVIQKALTKWRFGKEPPPVKSTEESSKLDILNTNTDPAQKSQEPTAADADIESPHAAHAPLTEEPPSERTSIDSDLKEGYREFLTEVDEDARFGVWRDKWRSFILYIENWPGRFDGVQDFESDTESESSDSEEEGEENLVEPGPGTESK